MRPPKAILYDIGDTLVRAAAPGTPVSELRATPIGSTVTDLTALAAHCRQGAVTDTSVMREADVRAALAGTGLDPLLEVVVTSVDVGAAKPDPRGLRAALAALGVDPGDALFVGDSPVDRGAAEAVGAAFVSTDPEAGAGEAVRRHLAERCGAFLAATWLTGAADDEAAAEARVRHDGLAKPPGSLGRLEDLHARLAAIAGQADPSPVASPALAVFAADHGVVEAGVTAWPSEVTTAMVTTMSEGRAVSSVLAAEAGVRPVVVDVGLASTVRVTDVVWVEKVRAGSRNLAVEAALTPVEVRAALDAGARTAERLVAEGADLLVTGEMGIGNTTSAAAVVAALTGSEPATVVGRGAGADDATLARKIAAVAAGLTRLGAPAYDAEGGAETAWSALSEVGGLEIAALAGFIVGGASRRVPVLLDGVITLAGALAAVALCPATVDYLVAGHRSPEPGASIALAHLGLGPLLDLGLRLGEGSGALLAVPLVRAAAAVPLGTATLDDLPRHV